MRKYITCPQCGVKFESKTENVVGGYCLRCGNHYIWVTNYPEDDYIWFSPEWTHNEKKKYGEINE